MQILWVDINMSKHGWSREMKSYLLYTPQVLREYLLHFVAVVLLLESKYALLKGISFLKFQIQLCKDTAWNC